MESRPTLVEEVDAPAPLPDHPPIDPAAALSAEVERVREHGDPLDPIKSLALGNGLLRAAIPAIAAAEVIEATPGTTIKYVAGGIALGSALAYENGRSAWLDRRRAKQRLRHDARETADATGQFVEFYRTGKPFNRDVTLMWYGPPTTATYPQVGTAGLLRTIDLARQAGVKKIAAPASIAKSVVGEDVQPYGSYRKWLLARKQRFVFGKAAKEPIYEATPDKWAEHIAGTSALNGLIHTLSTVYPNHPIVTTSKSPIYASLSSEVRRQKLTAVAQGAVDRRLTDIESVKVDRHNPQAPFYPLKRRAAHVTGTFTTDDKIQRFINGQPDMVTTVATEMHLSEARIKELLINPSADVVRGPQAIELAILRLLKEKKSPAVISTATGDSDEKAKDVDPIPFQARLLRLNHQKKGVEQHRRPKLIGHRLGRLALAGALVTGIGFGVNYAQTAGTKAENKAYAAAYIEVARKLEVPASSPQITDTEVYAQMYADHPWLKYWDDTNHYANDIGKFLVNAAPANTCFGPCPAPGGQIAAGADGDAFLGNASDGQPNRVDWTLAPHNMSAAGYWSEATSAELYAELKGINSYAPDIFWESELTVHDAQPFPSRLNPAQHPAYIRVSRQLQTGDSYYSETSNTNSTSTNVTTSADVQKNVTYYYLPVRENSSLAALDYTVDGKQVPVQVLPQPDGTYDLEVPTPEANGNLTYWIVPSHNRAHALKPNFYDPIGTLPFDHAAFEHEIAQYIDPGFFAQTPAERAAAVISTIGNGFTYAVDPIASNEMRGVTTLAGYENQVLLHRRANCNEANNILALVDPALNTVSGYSDNGSPDQQHGLYSHSVHMYAVDKHGNEYDATPSNVPRSEQAYFSTKGLPNPNAPMPLPWEVGGAVLFLSGLGLWQRRRITRGVNHVRVGYGNRLHGQLVAHGAAALSDTVEIVERGLYGPGLDIESSLRRSAARQREADAAATATKLITRPDLHTNHISTMLKAAQPSSNGHQQTLNSSRQIIKKARLARRILPRANNHKKH